MADTDKKIRTLEEYFESAKARVNTTGLDVKEFLSGLDAYLILPEEVSSIVTELHVVPKEDKGRSAELLNQLLRGAQIQPGASEAPGATQFHESLEVQSSLPVVPVTEGRQRAHEDFGEFVKYQHSVRKKSLRENIDWRRKITKEFVDRLRNDRLYGGGAIDENRVEQAINKAIEEPIYEKNRKQAEKIIADRISKDEVFARDREYARKFFTEAAEATTHSFDPILDTVTVAAAEAFTQNPTILDARPVLRAYASSVSADGSINDEALRAAARKAGVFASVGARPPEKGVADVAFTNSFNAGVQNIINTPEHKQKLLDRFSVDRVGEALANSDTINGFIKNSDHKTKSDLGHMVSGFMAPAYTPDPDLFDFMEASYRKSPDGVISADGFFQAKNHATPHNTHFEFHMPDLSWAIRSGEKNTGAIVAGAAIKETASKRAVAYGTKFLLGLGVKAGSKLMLVGAPVVGWIILIGVAFSGTVKKIGSSAMSKIAAGGLGSIRAASGAFSEFIQNALGTKYEDPNAANGWLLALGLAVLPFLLAFFFVTTTIQVQRAQFLPISTGIGPGGAPIDCTTEPDKSGPACNLSECVVKKEGDCQWPLDASSGACIIEGPFVGTHSGCKLSGIDFISLGGHDKLFGAPVYTPYEGIVERAVFGFDDYSGYEGNQDGGTYGNHVIIKTSDGGRLLFAHLRNIQTVSTGSSVGARSIVGFVDDTGYSLGVHLHYEDLGSGGCPRSGGDINKYTPFPVPPCEGYADCDAQLKSAGHAACLQELP